MANEGNKQHTFCEQVNVICETMNEMFFQEGKHDGRSLFVVALDTNEEKKTCDFVSCQLGDGFDLSYSLARAMSARHVVELFEQANEFRRTLTQLEQANKKGLN